MATLPFPDESPEAPIWTVSQLTQQIKMLLEEVFTAVRVVGEISNLSCPSSGHIYFNLKDETATLNAVIWKSKARRIPFRLENGLAVQAMGNISVYPPRGTYQLTVETLEPVGIGSLDLAFRQAYERLKTEGLFAPERKRPLPPYPSRIVVVSSPTGAAVRDFLQIVRRRWRAAEILIAPSRVQGEGAAEELAAALRLANQVPGADLIVLTRGGGSLEDLWAFNEEVLVRAIAASRLPVVSAVGHQVDNTLSDFVADFRAATPSEAAEYCVPDEQAARQELSSMARHMDQAVGLHLRDSRRRLQDLSVLLQLNSSQRLTEARLLLQQSQARIHHSISRCLADSTQTHHSIESRLHTALHNELDQRGHHLARLATALEAMSPLAVLGRGYSLTQRLEDRSILHDASTLHPGDRILTRLATGQIISRVESVETASPQTAAPE